MKRFVMFLTYSRILSGPIIFILSVYLELYLLTFAVFIVAALTDFLDGYLARKFNVDTAVGALMDPIADKIILCSALISIVLILNDPFIGLASLVILAREFWVSALREYSSIKQIQTTTKVTLSAKIKTATQFLSIALFFYSISYQLALGVFLASFILFLSMLLSIKTGIEYTHNIFNA